MGNRSNTFTRWLTQGPLQRWPWLLPAMSFVVGWLGFALIQRSEDMARVVAVVALIGWPWLLGENLLGGWLVRVSRNRLSPKLLGFVTQSLQQEILFFALPFLIGATQRDVGQIAFTSLVALVALISTIDPIYQTRIAARPDTSAAFHGFCTFIASLVVLPIAAAMPLEQAFPIAIAITGLWLLLCLPRMLTGIRDHRLRLVGIASIGVALGCLWQFRAHVPAAGLSLESSRITQTINNLQPGPAFQRIDANTLLGNGAIAFVAIRAPVGLSQSVTFEWWHRGVRLDQITEIIHGVGYRWRTFSRKLNFPVDPQGDWRVDVLTPQGQLICRLQFVVE